MVVTEVEEVGKKVGKLMMRWFSVEFFSDTESIGDSFAIFLIFRSMAVDDDHSEPHQPRVGNILNQTETNVTQ